LSLGIQNQQQQAALYKLD